MPIYTVTLNPALDRSLIVSQIVFGEVLRANSSQLDWGGKGFNVSRALKALGQDSLAMGYVGGATGSLLERGLHSLGIQTDFTYIAGETRTNTVIIEAATEKYIKVNEAGPIIQPTEQAAFLDKVASRVAPGDIWAFSGSLPPGLAVDFYAKLIRLVQAKGALACLDTSGPALQAGVEARPFLVKPNLVEAQDCSGLKAGSDNDLLAIRNTFLAQGIQLLALSLGAHGLLLASPHQTVQARPPLVIARNPTGAGDCLLAGLIWALARDCPLPDAARWGVAAGTAAAVQEGTAVGSQAEVARLFSAVTVI
jgi:1-phosphofructokinase family hexose kinase